LWKECIVVVVVRITKRVVAKRCVPNWPLRVIIVRGVPRSSKGVVCWRGDCCFVAGVAADKVVGYGKVTPSVLREIVSNLSKRDWVACFVVRVLDTLASNHGDGADNRKQRAHTHHRQS